MLAVDQDKFMMVKFLRLRSGTRDNEVLQQAERKFYTIVRQNLALAT